MYSKFAKKDEIEIYILSSLYEMHSVEIVNITCPYRAYVDFFSLNKTQGDDYVFASMRVVVWTIVRS